MASRQTQRSQSQSRGNQESSSNDPKHNHNDIIILDGGTGREIEHCGGPFRTPEWSALALYEAPHVVRQVHESYLNAGATAITTNTYAVVPFHLGTERYQRDKERLLNLAVDLAVQAKDSFRNKKSNNQNNNTNSNNSDEDNQKDDNDDNILILGSIPPICGSYEADKFDPTVSGPILQDFLNCFLGTNDENSENQNRVDVLLLETIGSIAEAKFYLQGIQEHPRYQKRNEQQPEKEQSNNNIAPPPPPPIWLSLCLKTEFGHDQTPTLLSGETLSEAVAALQQDKDHDWFGMRNNGRASSSVPRITSILVNCCDVHVVQQAVRELRTALSDTNSRSNNNVQTPTVRIGAYPNAFSIPPPDAANHTLRRVDYNINPEYMCGQATNWVQEGATIVGGCCGVGPLHICAMSKSLSSPRPSSSSTTTTTMTAKTKTTFS